MRFVTKTLVSPIALLGILVLGLHWATTFQVSAAPAHSDFGTLPVATGAVLYRVNAGGPVLPAADGSTPEWSADTESAPSPYVTFPTDQGKLYTTTKLVTLDPSVPAAVPMALFQTERFDQPPGGPFPLTTEMRWAFPVEQGKEVEIRLYFAEAYPPVDTPGERIFDVAVDGTVPPVFDNLDIIALAGGPLKGIVRAYTITSDGTINLDFLHAGVENPQIKGIEIVEVGQIDPNAPTVANPIENIAVLQDTAPTVLALANIFTDAEDGNNLTLSVAANSTPALLTPTLNGSDLTLTYSAGQFGSTVVTIRATDSTNLSVDESFVVMVNGKPTVNSLANQSVAEGAALAVAISAADPESEPIALTVSGLPNGALFTDNNDGTATLTWTPTFSDAGAYPIVVTATDSNGQSNISNFTITVTNANQPPVLNDIGNQATRVGTPLTVNISASDPDGDPVTLAAINVPNGASFADNGTGSGSLTWTPTASDVGNHVVTVTATDSENLSDVKNFTITVVEQGVNLPPVLAPINHQTISEGTTITLTIGATDGDGDAITLTAAGLPAGATFTDNQNGIGRLLWATTFDSAGVYTMTVTAQDSSGAQDTKSFKIMVINVNRKPTIAVTGAQTVVEGARMMINITATDADGDAVTIKATNVPDTATFTDNKDGTATLNWPTTVGDAGSYTFTITATDVQNASVTQTLNLTVNSKDSGSSTEAIFLPIIKR